ncbi:HAD family hydrolase [Kitasatospora sp. NBC_01539]|uniref:HAD family hydrolase n=1 Tax=Kitasatospora sp. NBC_01539 TaxID=2903577 RepID=UPI0038602279
MPLLLFDLDNTLLPRDAAFRAWAQDFLDEHRLPAGDIDWFTTIDGSGYVPRSTVLGAAKRRYGLDHSLELLLAHYRRGINAHIHCPADHVAALRTARASGWTLGIVSNGGTRPQLEKIRRTGLGPLVDGWVISEEAKCVKPDPLIFEIAARRCGITPSAGWESGTWMVGDHAPADIAGAELAGLRSVWLHQGRPWAERGYRPTLSAAGLPEAVGLVLGARNAPTVGTASRAAVRRAVTQQAAARRAVGRTTDAQPPTALFRPTPGLGAAAPAGTGTGAGTSAVAGSGATAAATSAAATAAAAASPSTGPTGPTGPADAPAAAAAPASVPAVPLPATAAPTGAAAGGRTRFAVPPTPAAAPASGFRGAAARYTVIAEGVAG